ncbi:MAG: DUF2332 family protein [Elusimicrobia bacterium]|nr:DUF2332 family protein [Elusimicrobiota bacterium]
MRRQAFLNYGKALSAYVGGKSPTYSEMLKAVLHSVEIGAPWFDRMARAWGGRTFTTDYEAPSLLLHQLHFAALAGEAPQLRAIFPMCSGKWTDGSDRSVIDFLEAAPASFWDELKHRRLQTNDSGRAAGWLLAACAAFLPRNLPFHLADMGTSAGLTLIGDYLPRTFTLTTSNAEPADEPPHWRDVPYPVLTRVGLDRSPVDLFDDRQRAWLRACLGPDNEDGAQRFDAAAELFLRLRRDPKFLQLIACPFQDMPQSIAAAIAPHAQEGLLIYNSQATDFLDAAGHAALAAGVAKALAPWGDRGIWVEFEMPRDKSSRQHQLRVSRLIEGRFETRTLAQATGKPMELAVLTGWDFLRPLGTSAPPRNTREEPLKTLEPGTYRFPPGG